MENKTQQKIETLNALYFTHHKLQTSTYYSEEFVNADRAIKILQEMCEQLKVEIDKEVEASKVETAEVEATTEAKQNV